MDSRWLFTAFDWHRFRELTPRVRAIGETVPPELREIEGTDEVLEEFDEEAAPEEVRNALLVEFCAIGEGTLFETGLPELLTWLRRQPYGDYVAEPLAEMISAAPGVEEWFAADSGIVGLLTIDETSELAEKIGRFRRHFRPAPRPRGLAALTRHFVTLEPAAEQLDELFEIVTEAAAEMLGLAAMRVA